MPTQRCGCYIHVPFCITKCLFCSFAVAIAQEHRSEEYADAVLREAAQQPAVTMQTLYLGGGTPSHMESAALANMVEGIKRKWSFVDGAEFTVEANPDDITPDKAALFKALGVNRVSLGAQSFNDAYLKFLGRNHNAAGIDRALDVLRGAGFNNISIDLMYGFPGQTREQLEQDLRSIIARGTQHVSIYELTIEPNSRFHAVQTQLDNADTLAAHYRFIVAALANAGIMQYEVSNFAREGFESKHNTGYWQGGDYIGLGMAAHSFKDGRRYWNKEKLQDYLASIKEKGHATAGEEKLNARTLFAEQLIFGLRMNKGIDVEELTKRTGLSLEPHQQKVIEALINEGYVTRQGGTLMTTMEGRLRLDDIAARLV